MNKRVIAVVVCTLLAMGGVWIYAPVLLWMRLDPAHPRYERYLTLTRLADRLPPEQPGSPRPAPSADRLRARQGVWMVDEPTWPPRFKWAWRRLRRREQPQQHEERVHWPLLLTEQAIILLLGGVLLAFVVRRERRRRAESPGA